MVLTLAEYNCTRCGKVIGATDSFVDHAEASPSMLRIGAGAHKGRFYNIAGDYTKTQRKLIEDQLMRNRSEFKHANIPDHVLSAVADKYNAIQKDITEDRIDTEGNICGKQKFVRRGNIKDEILAALIHAECIKHKLVRKKKDIAEFMKLPSAGFSRGEDILRSLVSEGRIAEIESTETMQAHIQRYLEDLEIERENYAGFITEVIETSERCRIGMNSQISSKVLGAIWIIITHCGLKITSARLEAAGDNTKKNTFVKFSQAVDKHMITFTRIFNKYKIPLEPISTKKR